MRPALVLACVLGLTPCAACQGGVIQIAASGAGGGASAPASGTGDAGRGGAPAACGWPSLHICATTEWCDDGTCGGFEAGGLCRPRPQACDADCPGACGCDGAFYCNGCEAHLAGAGVTGDLACKATAGTFRAINLVTGAPRFAVLKAAPLRGLCFRVVAQASQSASSGWAVGSVEVTDDVSDCHVPPGVFPPALGDAADGAPLVGGPWLMSSSEPCTVTIDLVATWTGAPAWVPQDEDFLASGVTVEGGCP